MARFLAVLIALAVGNSLAAQDANAIMAKVAASTSAATEARRQYVYHQKVTAAMSHANGNLVCREIQEFSAIPHKDSTGKQRTSLSGVCRQGKTLVPYFDPDTTNSPDKGDLEEIRQLVQDLVNAKNTRDGPPPEHSSLVTVQVGREVLRRDGACCAKRCERMAWLR